MASSITSETPWVLMTAELNNRIKAQHLSKLRFVIFGEADSRMRRDNYRSGLIYIGRLSILTLQPSIVVRTHSLAPHFLELQSHGYDAGGHAGTRACRDSG